MLTRVSRLGAARGRTHRCGPAGTGMGAAMLRGGYTINQVIHDYGDVCQAMTELAIERGQIIASDDFRVFTTRKKGA